MKKTFITDPNRSTANDLGIERQLIIESLDDIPKDRRIHFKRVGINRRHVTSPAQCSETYYRVTDVQCGSRPVTLGKPVDPFDDNVRAQPAHVATEFRNRAIGGHEQWKDVEPIEAVICLEPRIRAGGPLDQSQRFRMIPRMTIDQRASAGIHRPPESKQSILAARGADPFRTAHADEAIAGYPARFEDGRRQRLTRE